jgi:diacylglycerol kinase (ATP)
VTDGSGDLRRRILIIVNTAAGRSRRTKRHVDKVVAALQRWGCTVTVRRGGAASGDVERLAREAEAEFDVIVAAGGDGTMNAVANGLAGTQRIVALLPLGTANVLAHEIGLPRRAEALAELIVSGSARPVWPGRVGDRLFLTMASSGFDAETVAAVDPRLKRHVGRAAFALAILACLIRYEPSELTVQIDDVSHRASTVIATKGRFYAGPYVIAPEADLGAPCFALVLFRRTGRGAVLRYLCALLLGKIPRRRDIIFLRSREALISADRPIPVQADGEVVAFLPVALSVAERPMLLVQPRPASGRV